MPGSNDTPDTPSRGDVRGDVRSQIREFLSTRRARITPEQAKLPVYRTDRRRVSGLRREEVALLAGISSEYYIRLERGNATGISESVIAGIAHALQLDEAERRHLLDLLRTASTTRLPRRQPARHRVRPTVQRVIDSMHGTPAFVLNGRLDVLAANDLGRALYAPIYADPGQPTEQRQVRLHRPTGNGVLPQLGQGRQRHRRPSARRSRPRPLRPPDVGPHRRAVHP
jgi:transcriptional regulator with XRE-family HTH domain